MSKFKITYSVSQVDFDALHKEFDAAIKTVKSALAAEHPYWVNGKPRTSGQFISDYNPANTKELLGRFHVTPLAELDTVMAGAKKAQRAWGLTPWKERIAVVRKAADLIVERQFEISAIMGLEVGKNRIECLGDVQETADLLLYYAKQLDDAGGFDRKMAQLSDAEHTRSVLKPYGVFVIISPFNFPLALPGGMASGALLGGNAVVLKPSQETPWCALKLYECFRDAGLPAGVLQLVNGDAELGQALINRSDLDGVAFTGSYDVGMKIINTISKQYPKPCGLEMGGKNPAIICESADLEKAAQGCWKSAFGLSGQKCSALSRLYVHSSIKDKFLEAFLEKTKTTTIGDPLDKDIFMGPVIYENAVKRHLQAIKEANRDGTILVGGEDLRAQKQFAAGHFVQPTIAELPRNHRLFQQELFTPFVAVESFDSLDEAVELANNVTFGLTAGVFSQVEDELKYFMDNIQAGVLYANRAAGATTGAWPGVQAFCGWKGSGATGKGGCGPYYVQEFMREQSQTTVV